MRRNILLVTVALVTTAMMAATAMPALARHSPYDCRDTLYALYRGEELTALQQEIVSAFPSFGVCVRDSLD